MGARGPLKVVGGTGTVSVPESAASVVQPEAPRKPAGVAADKELSELWDEIVPDMDRAGLLTPTDAPTLEVMLRHLLMVRMAHREVLKTGTVVVPATDDGVEKKHPAEAVLRMESAFFLDYAKQMGATWMARARTASATPAGEGQSGNPFGAHASGE